MPPTAATATSGFFQVHPQVANQWVEDTALERCARLFLPQDVFDSFAPSLHSFASEVMSSKVFAAKSNADRDLPYIQGSGFTSFGAPANDALVTSEGWKQLQAFGLRHGIVASGYHKDLGAYARVYQALKLYLWCASATTVTCPSAMQDGAISVLARELLKDGDAPGYPKELQNVRRKVFSDSLIRLLSTDPDFAWTSGQWMTERAGGSDVSGTETVATWAGLASHANGLDGNGNPLGPWSVDGFKWFSSATDCGCVVFLAKTDDSGRLSCFFAPTRITVDGKEVMNGIRMQRLKNKLGTKALPTAELEIKGMRAWLVGEEGRGVMQIATVLNITRLYNAVCSSGQLGRGLGIARAFARVRQFPSRRPPQNSLRDLPLFAKTMAGVALTHRADALLTHFVAALAGAADHPQSCTTPLIPRDPSAVSQLVRLVTPITKAYTAKHAIWGLQECMEALGGTGYCENVESPEINVAALFRDANVLAIWEGTTDVLSTDTIKVLQGKAGNDVIGTLSSWLDRALEQGLAKELTAEKKAIRLAWAAVSSRLTRLDKDEALSRARHLTFDIGDIISAALLAADAERDGCTVAAELARRFVRTRPVFGIDLDLSGDWREESLWDKRIVFESDNKVAHSPSAKL